MELTEFELKRYNRQMVMDGRGEEIQKKLKKQHVYCPACSVCANHGMP